MRLVHLAAMVAMGAGLAAGLGAGVPSGVRGVVDNKLQGVAGYNDAINDAMGGQDDKKLPPPVAAPGAIKAGWMTRRSKEGKDVRLYFAYPEGLTKAKPAAGLIVVQERWGVNEEMQLRAREFAARGFYAVAPDLFGGKVTEDPAEAQKLKDAAVDSASLSAMKTGLDLLQEEEGNGVVDAKRVGAVGWDMGGQQALLLSLADPRIKATALFYGPLVTEAGKLKDLQGPVLGIFGGDDKAPSTDDVKKWQTGLKYAGKTDVTVSVVEGMGHGFASKSAAKTGTYNEAKAKEAMDKLYAWLDAKLPR